MINLLPEKFKKDINLVFVYRRIVVIFSFFAIALAAFSVFLFFLRMLLIDKNNYLRAEIDLEQKKMETTQLKEFRDLIQQKNKQLNKVNQIWAGQFYIYPILNKFFDFLPEGIYLKNISFQRLKGFNQDNGSGNLASVNVSGVSLNRDILISFVETIKSEPLFKKVDISNSVFLKQDNINFSLSFFIADKP